MRLFFMKQDDFGDGKNDREREADNAGARQS